MHAYPSLTVPSNMELKDVCNLVSYLSIECEKNSGFFECDPRAVVLVQEELIKRGFIPNKKDKGSYYHSTHRYVPLKKYNLDEALPEIEDCLDLFIVDGNSKLFNKTTLNDRYFDWYNESVSKADVTKFLNRTNNKR